LVIYIDGQRFGDHHILSAVGVDAEGTKHILGIESGATENAASVQRLLTHLRDQGLATDRKYLFVIDGAKALRAAIEEVFGSDQPQPTGGHEGDVHLATPEDSRIAPQMPGDHQHYRKLTGRGRAPHAQRDALEGRGHGATLGRFSMGPYRKSISVASTATPIFGPWQRSWAERRSRPPNLQRRK
jgi:Transposase, Mutator family